MARNQRVPKIDVNDKRLRKMAHLLDEMVEDELGQDATFEEESDAAAELVGKAHWLREEWKFRHLTTTAAEVEVAGVKYSRMEQPSSAVYFGRYGAHEVTEPLYRQIGVRNGPTVKPVEARLGIIGNLTPDLARIVSEHGAHDNSRETERQLLLHGLVSPSRAVIARRQTQIAHAIKAQVAHLEASARGVTPVPDKVATVSCGMDRMAVRMIEPANDDTDRPRRRTEPYERTPPDPKDYPYRMAWVGSVSAHDEKGELLHTWRYALDAQAAPGTIARRICAQVTAITDGRPEVRVHCIQDEGKELKVLPDMLEAKLDDATKLVKLTDLQHLLGYLEDVVDACEPEGDPRNFKLWFRAELLNHDDAIDRIWDQLKRRAGLAKRGDAKARNAIGAALSYIRKRKHKMRYATHYAAHRPIGSGETENTCGQMQTRVKRRGQSWEIPGLSGILSLRSLVLSGSWEAAWSVFAAQQRKKVRRVR